MGIPGGFAGESARTWLTEGSGIVSVDATEESSTNAAACVGALHVVPRAGRVSRSGRAPFSERLCAGCGRLFHPRRADQRACSGACRARSTRQAHARRVETCLCNIARALSENDVVRARDGLAALAVACGIAGSTCCMGQDVDGTALGQTVQRREETCGARDGPSANLAPALGDVTRSMEES